MNRVFVVSILASLPTMSLAQPGPSTTTAVKEGSYETGEVGYKIGCAAARAANVNTVCGELYELRKAQAQEAERRRKEYLQKQSENEEPQ